MCTTTTISKVRNYQGTNSFVIKMKESLNKWGNLTPKQIEAVEKCMNSEVKVDVENLNEELQKIAKYEGENNFVKDIKEKLLKYGTLTQSQMSASLKQIQKEEDKNRTLKVRIPTVGETIKVGRTIGQGLKEKYGLEFNPILIDITKITAVSPKAVQFKGKMTIKRGNVCMCCAKTLTDEFSMLTKLGKICAKHMKIEYITDASQAERLRNDYLKRVDEIGEMEFWVPKKQILLWSDNVTKSMVDSMF
jgi:hypothetical protein